MGYRVKFSRETVVTHIIGPGPKAEFGKEDFQPDADFQHSEIDRIYQASGRRDAFLGDWHTHPHTTPFLSRRDRAAIRKVAKHPMSHQPHPIMAILAGGDPWRLIVWRYDRPKMFGPECFAMIVRKF
jgi:integrative and conjugative element protein (TIGR02256 family)